MATQTYLFIVKRHNVLGICGIGGKQQYCLLNENLSKSHQNGINLENYQCRIIPWLDIGGFISLHWALWGFNGDWFCKKAVCWSETPPAPDAYLQWSHCLAFNFVRWKPMLLLLSNFSNRYGRASRTNGGFENIMRPLWDTATVKAGHLDGVSCRWVCELRSSPNACRRSGTAPGDRCCL